MKPSKAIDALKNLRLFMQLEDKQNEIKFAEHCYEAVELAIQALEKQIPKKVEIRNATCDDIESELRDFITTQGKIRRCPTCKDNICVSGIEYCWYCGQKLDWSEE